MKFTINIDPDNKEDIKEITLEEIEEGLECYFAQTNILVTVKANQLKSKELNELASIKRLRRELNLEPGEICLTVKEKELVKYIIDKLLSKE